MSDQVIRQSTDLFNDEFPSFKLNLMESWKENSKRKFLYFKTSTILKSIGVNDSISSLINPETSTGKRYEKLFESVNKRGKYKNAYYFSIYDMKLFLKLYRPNGEEKRELWQSFGDWVNTLIREHLDKNPIEKKKNPKRKVILNTLTTTAKLIGIGVKKDLVPFLIENRFLYRQQGTLLPYEIKIRQKLFSVREIKIDKVTHHGVVPQVFVTEKGHEKIKELWNRTN